MRQKQGRQQFRVTARVSARVLARDGLFVVMQEKKLKGQEKLQTLRKPRPVEVRLAQKLGPERAVNAELWIGM